MLPHFCSVNIVLKMNAGYKIISLVPDQAHAGYTLNGKWLTAIMHTASTGTEMGTKVALDHTSLF